jgi:hypothetical protein
VWFGPVRRGFRYPAVGQSRPACPLGPAPFTDWIVARPVVVEPEESFECGAGDEEPASESKYGKLTSMCRLVGGRFGDAEQRCSLVDGEGELPRGQLSRWIGHVESS